MRDSLLLIHVIALLGCMLALAAADSRVDIFVAGEMGYFCVKIPDLLVTKNNVILAFGEARMDSCSDFAHTDLVMKRSLDNGTTWSAMTIVVTNSSATEKNVIGNAAPVQDRNTGRILLPYCRNNHEVFMVTSDDDGSTWTAPVSIPTATKPNWKWIGLGPPAALQLESGRIVIPSYHETILHEDGTFTKGHTVISDDAGATWRLGQSFGGIHFPNEAQAVDLGNNTVMINARGIGTRRLEAISRDGGETFPEIHVMSDLPESWDGCEGSIIRLAETGVLLFSNPHEGGLYRYNMSLLASHDNGKSWIECKLIDSGASGYSALSELHDGSVAILYERSKDFEVIFTPQQISFERVWFPGCNSVCGC